MKTQIYDEHGKKAREMELPKIFSTKIREDIVAKVLESKKIIQPYSPSPVAGNQYSASGKFNHRRHVWKTLYGKGISRIPRKIMSRRGSQFNMQGATIPGTKGGRRAHPPKILHLLTRNTINKKEMKLALISALSATANSEMISKKYSRLNDEKVKAPFVVESKFLELKTKDFLKAMKEILGEKAFSVAVSERKVRSGVGKMRGRKYKENAGAVLVVGKKEKSKTNVLDMTNAENIGVLDLAEGGMGRIAIYTEEAIKELGEKLK